MEDISMTQNLFNTGARALMMGDYKRAEEIFEGIIHDQPLAYEAWNNLGVAYYQQWSTTRNKNTLGEAQKAFEQAVNINPSFADALNNLGNLLDDLGEIIPGLAEEKREHVAGAGESRPFDRDRRKGSQCVPAGSGPDEE